MFLILNEHGNNNKCNSLLLTLYFTVTIQFLDFFDNIEFEHVSRELNWEVDEPAQIASGVKRGEELTHKLVAIEKKNHPLIFEMEVNVYISNNDMNIVRD